MIINRPGDMYNITIPYLNQNPQGLLALHVKIKNLYFNN